MTDYFASAPGAAARLVRTPPARGRKGLVPMSRLHVGLFNDSFPPTIDGVAQAVKNYAGVLQRNHCDVTVVTPGYRHVVDDYPFEVYRYQSIPLDKRIGYRAGVPFNPETIRRLHKKHFDLLHVHAPFASSVLVQNINHYPRVPVVFTYHTKFDIDIATRVPNKNFRKIVMRFIRHNINAADEVWVVSEGCGKALRSVGYLGNYRVMPNGTDFTFGRATPQRVAALRDTYALRDDEFVFLFVGRMMWYKNIRLILDALKTAKTMGLPFRAFLIGDGYDAPAIKRHAVDIGVSDRVVFTGPIYNRETLRAYYSMADLFLFPSTYDTSGIVIKEAAACSCPALLVRGSCAAEGVIDGVNGFLVEENAAACAKALLAACQSRSALAAVGERAGQDLYLSWDTAVERAYRRYKTILERWQGPRSRWF